MVLLFSVEQLLGASWGKFGVLPGSISQWWGVFTFPWLHGDWNHLFSNAISLFFVGALVRYSFPRLFDRVWLWSLLAPGVGLWLVGRASYHIGASAWLYALVAFVFFSGVLRLHLKLLAQSMLMVFLYGSFIWGMLPHDPTVSWEGHLSGAVVGFLLALYYRKEEPIEALKNQVYVHEEVEWDDWKVPAHPEPRSQIHPFFAPLYFERILPQTKTPESKTPETPNTPSSPPPRPQFRYGDGSSPDEWV